MPATSRLADTLADDTLLCRCRRNSTHRSYSCRPVLSVTNPTTGEVTWVDAGRPATVLDTYCSRPLLFPDLTPAQQAALAAEAELAAENQQQRSWQRSWLQTRPPAAAAAVWKRSVPADDTGNNILGGSSRAMGSRSSSSDDDGRPRMRPSSFVCAMTRFL
jgi:hypothetical protein